MGQSLADLAEAQQRLSKLLIAEDRDVQAIAEAADAVRRCERQALAADRGGRDAKAKRRPRLDRRGIATSLNGPKKGFAAHKKLDNARNDCG